MMKPKAIGLFILTLQVFCELNGSLLQYFASLPCSNNHSSILLAPRLPVFKLLLFRAKPIFLFIVLCLVVEVLVFEVMVSRSEDSCSSAGFAHEARG
jgi:hypothetical protein